MACLAGCLGEPLSTFYSRARGGERDGEVGCALSTKQNQSRRKMEKEKARCWSRSKGGVPGTDKLGPAIEKENVPVQFPSGALSSF